MSKYDFDTFIKRTMWWRICNSIVLALLSLTLIFTNQTISNYGEATQRHLRVLHEKIDNLQRKVDAIESIQPSAPQAVNAHVKLHQEIRVWALKSAPP